MTKKKHKIDKIQEQVEANASIIQDIKSEVGKIIVGQQELINRLLIAILSKKHVLLEGVPGLAKTTAIATLAKIFKVDFQRIQFTPDLLPSDLTGNRIYNPKEMSFFIRKGPIFANFILADEINRSPAKVQSALLESMQEKQVTIGNKTFKLPDPFFVMATQNPIENEGTYPLPEAQIDRFLLKTVIDYPNKKQELEIINRAESSQNDQVKPLLTIKKIHQLQENVQQVYMDESIKKYIVDIIFTSRLKIDPQEQTKSTNYSESAEGKFADKDNGSLSSNADKIGDLKKLIQYGASPRASIGLMQAAKALAFIKQRAYVIPEDVKDIAPDVLRHRIILTYEAQAQDIEVQDIIKQILSQVKVP